MGYIAFDDGRFSLEDEAYIFATYFETAGISGVLKCRKTFVGGWEECRGVVVLAKGVVGGEGDCCEGEGWWEEGEDEEEEEEEEAKKRVRHDG